VKHDITVLSTVTLRIDHFQVIITDLCVKELDRPRKTDPLKGIIPGLLKLLRGSDESVTWHVVHDGTADGYEMYPNMESKPIQNLKAGTGNALFSRDSSPDNCV
jgi:hypothetical protein